MSLSEMANELGVNYIVEGSGQKNGNEILLTINLLDAISDKSIFSENYRREINEVKEYFDLQGDIAINVSLAIQARLTPQEKEQMEKIPTENITAYNLYLQGLEFMNLAKNSIGVDWDVPFSLVQQAKNYFEEAINVDTTFAEAYAWLGHIYINMLSFRNGNIELSEQYIDSGFAMAQKALLLDNEIAFAYGVKAAYYTRKGKFDEAKKCRVKVNKLKKNHTDWEGNISLFWTNSAIGDHYNALKYYFRYKETKPEEQNVTMNELYWVFKNLNEMGYPEAAQKVAKEMLTFDNDSLLYYDRLWESEYNSGNFKTSLEYILKANKVSNFKHPYFLYNLSLNYMILNDEKKAVDAFQLVKENMTPKMSSYNLVETGYLNLLEGLQDSATNYFQKTIEENLTEIHLNRPAAQKYDTHFCLACVYSTLNQKEKAMGYLVQLKKRDYNDVLLVTGLKYHPMLDNIRGEPEFAKVLKVVETKYQKEHERVGKLLRELEVIE